MDLGTGFLRAVVKQGLAGSTWSAFSDKWPEWVTMSTQATTELIEGFSSPYAWVQVGDLPLGGSAIARTEGRALRILDCRKKTSIRLLSPAPEAITCIASLPSHQLLASGNRNGSIAVWRLTNVLTQMATTPLEELTQKDRQWLQKQLKSGTLNPDEQVIARLIHQWLLQKWQHEITIEEKPFAPESFDIAIE